MASCCGPVPASDVETTADGSTLPSRLLYGRREECCPSLVAEEAPRSIPLPPEQRGKIHRALAEDEGDDGRWMDVPNPCEVWNGAVGLTTALTRDAFLQLLPQQQQEATGDATDAAFSGGDKENAAVPQDDQEGTELEEKVALAPMESASPPPPPSGGGIVADDGAESSETDEYHPDCITRAPSPNCLPPPPCGDDASPDDGVKERTDAAPRRVRYGRDHPADAQLCGQEPGECVADMVTLQVQLAATLCPLHLFVPGLESRNEGDDDHPLNPKPRGPQTEDAHAEDTGL